MFYWRYFMVIQLIASVSSGCSSDMEARNVTRVTLSQIIVYENNIDRKISSEQNYYKQSLLNFSGFLSANLQNEKRGVVTGAAQKFSSHLYNAQLDEKFLGESIANLVTAYSAHDIEYHQKLIKYNKDISSSLNKLGMEKKSLKKARKGLEHLQKESSETDSLKEYFETAKEVKALVEANSSSDNK